MAFEDGAGVLEVLFGVGFGGGDALKRFVEDADNPLLLAQRGSGKSIAAIYFGFISARGMRAPVTSVSSIRFVKSSALRAIVQVLAK